MESEGAPQEKLFDVRGALLLAALLGGNFALALGPWLVRLADTGPVSAAPETRRDAARSAACRSGGSASRARATGRGSCWFMGERLFLTRAR